MSTARQRCKSTKTTRRTSVLVRWDGDMKPEWTGESLLSGEGGADRWEGSKGDDQIVVETRRAGNSQLVL